MNTALYISLNYYEANPVVYALFYVDIDEALGIFFHKFL